MKRKFFSALLMGAMVVASTSTMTSCKDYDDDIKDLQSQIDKAGLKSDIEALQKQLTDAAATASAAKTTAESALTKANAAATQTALDAVKATADKAAQDVATAIANAATAQSTADGAATAASNAATAAAAAQETADKAIQDAAAAAAAAATAQETANGAATKAELQAALTRIGTLEQNSVTATTLDEKLNALKADVLAAAGDKETVSNLATQVAGYKGAIEELYSAVTSVELVESYSGIGGNTYKVNWGANLWVNMVHGLIEENSVFGDETTDKVDPTINYTKGQDVKDDASIVVRVNPVNADLTKGAKIVLLNSKGESLENIVEVGTPEKFDKLITTRASQSSTGLWKLPISVAKGVTEEDFQNAVTVEDNGEKKRILYAVAVNNTDKNAADRYVVSSYDVAPWYEKFAPSNDFTFEVAGKSVYEIHNRWTGSIVQGENPVFSTNNPELKWNANGPAIAPIVSDDAKVNNVKEALDDARYNYQLLQVKVGQTFSISNMETTDSKAVDYYYVVLDKKNAIESGVSEINAWNGYKIDGLGKTVKGSDELKLTIQSESANGDVIGFRVYAVNRDGKLLDPDGKAFYVIVGDAITNSINGDLDASTNKTEKKAFNLPEGVEQSGWKLVSENPSEEFPLGVPSFTITYLDKNGKVTTDEHKATQILFNIDASKIKDGATINFKNTLYKSEAGNQYEAGVIYASYTKVLPNEFPASITFRPKQETTDGSGNFIAYMKPANGWAINGAYSTTGTTDLENIFYGLDENVSFSFAEAAKDGDKIVANTDVNHVVTEAVEFIDSKTKHKVTATYNYGNISLVKDKDGNWVNKNWTVDSKKDMHVTFACWNTASTYAWAAKKQPSLQWKAAGNTATASFADVTAHNTYNNDFFGGTFAQLLTNKYLVIKDNTAHLKVSGQEDPYFKATIDATNNKVTFTQANVQVENAPTADHVENLEFIVIDQFGHELTMSFPVTIKAPAK